MHRPRKRPVFFWLAATNRLPRSLDKMRMCVITQHAEESIAVIPIHAGKPLKHQTSHIIGKIAVYLAAISLLMEIVGVPLRPVILEVPQKCNELFVPPPIGAHVAHDALRNAIIMPLDHLFEDPFVTDAPPSRLLDGTKDPLLQSFILQGIDPCA